MLIILSMTTNIKDRIANKKSFLIPAVLFTTMITAFLLTPKPLVNRYLLVHSTVALVDNVDIEWMGYTSQKIVALTFDDGPDPRFTPKILAILAKDKIPATFFVVGANATAYPGLVAAEVAAGHEVGNHTLSHVHLSRFKLNEISKQLSAADRAIAKAAGQSPRLFRPPYEELNENILTAARKSRKKIIMSTITLEHHTLINPQDQARRVVNMVFPGAIILAHDGRVNRTQTVAALPYLIEGLKAKGYRIVAIKELLNKNL